MKKFLKITKFLLAGVGALIVAALIFIVSIAQTHQDIKKADGIIILGAAINTPALYNRSMHGLKLYQQGKADLLILSGGRISQEDISEAQYMEKVIKQNAGVPVRIILEQDSRSTFENIYNSKAAAPEVKSVIVVSDKFHLARAFLVAKRVGYEKVYWSAPESDYYKKEELAFYYFREALAILWYMPKLVMD
jgi:uncharacterized SAM-binding protein YcdF (DUF218 family)